MSGYSEVLQEEYKEILRRNTLFDGLDDSQINAFIRFAAPEYYDMEPGRTISLSPGGKRRIGVLLEGDVKVYTVDYAGNRTVINVQRNRGFVGTMQFMVDQYNMLYEIVAGAPSKLLVFDPDCVLKADPEMVAVQHRVLVNIMRVQRQLFLNLSDHMVCLAQKTIRDKVLRYLQNKSEQARAYEFDISLSREDMAAYLAVDRASLSRTLGELKREGVIDFRRRHFKILDTKHFHY